MLDRYKTLENGEIKSQLLIVIECHSISHRPNRKQQISLSLEETSE